MPRIFNCHAHGISRRDLLQVCTPLWTLPRPLPSYYITAFPFTPLKHLGPPINRGTLHGPRLINHLIDNCSFLISCSVI